MSIWGDHPYAMTHTEREDNQTCQRQHRDAWVVDAYKVNHSAFNGYHPTRSDYSAVRCTRCGRCWRTRAAYVDSLPGA